MMKLREKLQSFALLLIISLLSTVTAWAASGDVLFSQNFNSATAVAYDAPSGSTPKARTYNSSNPLSGLAGSGTNLFTSIATSIKKGDIAINSSTGGNSVDATGFFQAYAMTENAAYWSLTRNSDFAATAPTALKVSMDIWYKNGSSGSAPAIQFAIGDEFTDGLVSTSPQDATNVHSGFGIRANSNASLTAYNNQATSISGTTYLTQSTWLSLVWIINNTGEALVYDNPTGSGTSTVNNDCFDIWLKTQAGAITTYTKVVTNSAAVTSSKDLQNIYIGHNVSGKTHEFRLDNIVVTDLTPGDASSNPKVTSAVSPTGAGTVTMRLTSSSGDEIDSGDEVESGSTVWLSAANNTGYTFSSWSGDASGTTNPTTVASITSDKTFTANFTANTYSITLDKGTGGSADGSATATYNSATLTSKTDATHATKTLAGYYTAASAGTKVINADGTLLANVDGYTGAGGKWICTDDVTLYAQWTDAPITYNLTTNTASTTFNACASVSPTTGNVVASSTISTYGTAGALATGNSAKTDETQKLTIDEEYTAANYYEWTFAVGSGKMFTPSAVNMKFQAVSDLVQYKVVLTDGTTSYETTFTNTTSKGSTLETLAWNITPTKGLTSTVRLKLWAYKAVAGNNAAAFRLGSPITITGSVETAATLYTVSFEDGTSGDHGTYASTPVTQTSAGGTVTLPTVTADTGYTFSGWNTAADGTGSSYASGATYTPESDITLYAIYTPNTYTVTLDGNGGTGGSASVTATYEAALPSFTAPIRSGYVLTGYYTETSGGTKVIDVDGTLEAGVTGYTNSESEWIGTSATTLHAQWAAVYTVTFDATTNEGTCSTASLTQSEPSAKIILPAATKEGYTFDGWYTLSSGGSLIGAAAFEYEPTANITLYAQFSAAVSTEKFHFLSKLGSDNIKASTELEITESTYADDVDGGHVYYFNSGSSRDHSYGLKLGGNAEYIKIVLDEALAIGDVISFAPDGSYKSSNQICFTTESTRNTTNTTVEFSYTVTSTDGLAGESTIYIWRTSGSTTYVKELTITSSGAAATYAISYDMGGIADDIEQLTEQTALPNPLPTPTGVTDGYTFEGWYTNSTFTTRATAGAAIAANTTLYANYIIDTPVITPAAGAYPAKTTMTLTSSVPFTQAYGGWTTGSAAYSHSTLLAHGMYDDEAIDVFNGFTTPAVNSDSQHFTYMVSDGTFFSEPAVTEAYTVNNVITISVHPQNATYVVGGSATALTVVAADTADPDPGATKSYQWEVSDDNSSWENVGTNSASYTPDITTAGTKYYRVTVSSDKSVDPVVSNVATITVNAAATYTVSFDAGVGSDDTPADATQGSVGATITLPSLAVKENYQFVGWYLDDVKVANADATTYLPSGTVTLLAKYNCKVELEKNEGGDGNVPTAVIKGTSTTVASGDFVFEGTTLTLTASPADKFVNWSNGMTGTDNPKDYMVNAYKRFVANYTAKEYLTLYHTDFTESAWSAIDGKNGGTVTAGTSDTMTDPTVTLAASSDKSYGYTSGSLTLPKNYDSDNYIAIPVRGVNGELTITVAKGTSKTQFKYNVVVGASTEDPGSGTSSTAAKPSTVTVAGLTASNYVVYIGRQSGSYNQYTEITITTPSTKLAADSAQVRIMKNPASDTPTATVHITTNSSGAVSIKTDPTSSIATAAYSEGTLTITPKGAGTTSVVMQVAASGDYTARELTIPITVQVPNITINTQPSNIVCYQNDAADKTFTVVATVNTGNELTYQWYRNTAASTTSPTPTAIPGATSATYTLNTSDKATVGTNYYYFCRVTSADDDLTLDTEVKSVTVSELSAGGTYNTTVYAVAPGNTVTYTDLASNTISSDTGSSYYDTDVTTANQIEITAKATGSGVITLDDGTVINVTVKNHTVQLIWSAEKVEKDVTDWATDGTKLMLGTDSNPEGLPTLTRLYEDGSPYTGTVTYYIDDTSMAFFNTSGTGSYTQTSGVRPNIYYAGGQGGCKFYAYIGSGTGIEPVKASYDLRLKKGYSNDLPSGRKVEVQQQYTLWKNATDKLITVTYGGYKYNDHKWDGKADSWGTATNYVGKDNAIDGYLYAVRNKDRDAKDEYEHALQDEDNFGSAWYAIGEGGATREYQRIKPFRLPCRASYITFTAHASGTLTAYVYQNGIIGRGTGAGNQLASAPRLGYWFDEEGWVQEPANTVVTKQVIQKGNARDQRSYGGYADMDAQLDGYWKDDADAIIKTKLRSPWCSVEKPDKDTPASAFSLTQTGSYTHHNPYYWGSQTEVEDNLAEVVPTPERPIPHQGGHMIVNEGYVKYTINVKAGHTYYFFGKMTKVGYAGMNFVPADSENRQTSPVHLTGTDVWSEKFDEGGSSVLKSNESTIYDQITLPSNYRIGKWNTICLPFAVSENQVEEVFGKGTELAIFNGLRHDTENHVYYIKYLRHVDQNILPGQPYLIYPTGRAVAERTNQENGGMAETGETIATVGDSDPIIGSTSTGGSGTRIVFKNVLIKKSITAQSYGCNLDADGTTTSYEFKGTDQPLTIEKYDLYNTPKNGGLARWMSSNNSTLNSYHALIKAYPGAEIRHDAITFAFTEDDVDNSWETSIDVQDPDDPDLVPTRVEIVENGNADGLRARFGNGKTYNLMGQEVDANSVKGIVIGNGNKYIFE